MRGKNRVFTGCDIDGVNSRAFCADAFSPNTEIVFNVVRQAHSTINSGKSSAPSACSRHRKFSFLMVYQLLLHRLPLERTARAASDAEMAGEATPIGGHPLYGRTPFRRSRMSRTFAARAGVSGSHFSRQFREATRTPLTSTS